MQRSTKLARPARSFTMTDLKRVRGGAEAVESPPVIKINIAMAPEYTRNVAKPGSAPK